MLFCATIAVYRAIELQPNICVVRENVVAQISNLSILGESTECYSVLQLRFTAL